jgi:hypothetical protein
VAYFAVEMAEEKQRNVQKSYLQTDVITGVKSRGLVTRMQMKGWPYVKEKSIW